MSRSVPRADRSGVANCQEDAPRTAFKPQPYERGGRLPEHRLPRIVGYILVLAPLRRQHGGQQSIVPSDFALIPKVLNESDACDHADGQGGQQEVPREKGDRGTAYLVTAQRGKGKLEVKMMRKAHRSGASC